jgi:hypothetical protein
MREQSIWLMSDLPSGDTGITYDSLVLFCLIRRRLEPDGPVRFLFLENERGRTFPPTKYRPGEDLQTALHRPMVEDLGLPPGSFFVEEELPAIPNIVSGPSYHGLGMHYYLYPIDISLSTEGWNALDQTPARISWLTVGEAIEQIHEPNIIAIASTIRCSAPGLLTDVRTGPSMDAMASDWATSNLGGVRVLKREVLTRVLDAGDRAFNLRVADPYKPYQKQGLGFTWSFFTSKDHQDIHVHGLPAVEIYGILKGSLQLWYKPMNERGVRTWKRVTLHEGDWVEVEPLHCHFACWAGTDGLGVVIKAAASGELAGVGPLGVAGKTTCEKCNVHTQCALHPRMVALAEEYGRPFEERDYGRIERLIAGDEV